MARALRQAWFFLLAAAATASLAACGSSSDGTVRISIVGSESATRESGARLSSAARVLRAATVEGLVGFDEEGRVIPALADRWIVTDDGRSYIFRLRDANWADGSPITGDVAAATLRRTIAGLRGTALALDLAEIDEIRAMAGRVVEVRLRSPVPDLLTLLAQPELGIAFKQRGTGPMAMQREGQELALRLIPPEQMGLPAIRDFKDRSLVVRVRLEDAAGAVERFNNGDSDAVVGGRIDSLPLAGASGLIRGNVRLDPVIGLFGLSVERGDGFLANPANREALAMAIDRDGLLGAFNISGWQPTTRIVSPDVEDDLGTVGERWTGMSLDERRSDAAARVARWKAGGNAGPVLRLALPQGPGSRIILDHLSADLAAIGVTVRAVGENAPAELRLVDVVARYGRATWFLNQLSCAAGRAVCSEIADARLLEARAATDPEQRSALLAEAEAELTSTNSFIPFARPLRWSLVRSSVSGFAPSPWGWHPLPPMALLPR